MGTFQSLTRVMWGAYRGEADPATGNVKRVSDTTVTSCVNELIDAGLLIRPKQFDWTDVADWERGRPYWNANSQQMECWAFNQYFLTECPFAPRNRTRVRPPPRGPKTERAPFRAVVPRSRAAREQAQADAAQAKRAATIAAAAPPPPPLDPEALAAFEAGAGYVASLPPAIAARAHAMAKRGDWDADPDPPPD